MKFANLYLDSKVYKNMGEDMMIFSIFNLYHHMGVDRDSVTRVPVSKMRDYDGEDVLLPLNYPFYGLFALSPKIHPVFLGISVLHGAVAEYMRLKEYEPIGCRDLHTYKVLKQKGIDVYLNGCLTITLPKRERPKNLQKVYLVDVPPGLKEYLPASFAENIVELSQNFFDDDVQVASEEYTRHRYEEYINEASLVVSSRLHCILPCAAAGIPTVLAVNAKSSRYNWLENIMPIYTSKRYGAINWNPEPLEFEKEKKMLLDHAASRVWAEYRRLTDREFIQTMYMNSCDDYSIESIRDAATYMKEHWRDKGRGNRYILWGVTQTAELLYDNIREQYPEAELVGVVDKFNKQDFHGISTSSDDIIKNDGTTVFVTAESANEYAKRLFVECGNTNYVICWSNPKTNVPVCFGK